MRLAGLPFVIALAVGCVGENPDLVSCTKSADCPIGLFCRNAQCTVPEDDDAGGVATPDGGGVPRDGGPTPDGGEPPRPDAAPVGESCEAVCAHVAACVVGPDCPLVDADAQRFVEENCLVTCRESPSFGDAVRGQRDCAETVDWLARGSDEFADACLGEGPPDACAQGLAGDADCDPRLDCCDRGLVCVDLGGGARCQTACDAHREPNGCGERAFCNPFAEAEPNQPRPGVCVPGDDCVPGGEANVCDGPATCIAVPPASFCLPAGDAAEGTACTQRGDRTIDNCRAGLVCAYGRCQPPCDGRGRCEVGRCIDYSERLDGLPYRFCYDDCEVYRQRGCDDEQVCEVVDTDGDGGAVGACRPADPGDGRQGDRCRSLEGRYWGDCHPGHVCGRLAADRGEQCIGLCDRTDSRLCTGRSRCVFGLLDDLPDLGVCIGECDVFVGSQCGDGRMCLFIAVGSERWASPVGAWAAPTTTTSPATSGVALSPTTDSTRSRSWSSSCFRSTMPPSPNDSTRRPVAASNAISRYPGVTNKIR